MNSFLLLVFHSIRETYPIRRRSLPSVNPSDRIPSRFLTNTAMSNWRIRWVDRYSRVTVTPNSLQDTFATTVIVQRHPLFITTAAEAYDLRCTYPLGIKEVASHVNVSDPEASKTLSDEATGTWLVPYLGFEHLYSCYNLNISGPICRLSVTNSDNEHVSSAIVGESLTLQLSVQPNGEEDYSNKNNKRDHE